MSEPVSKPATIPAPANASKVHKEHQCQLFQQPGYRLANPIEINRDGFIWNVKPQINQKDDRLSIDLMIKIMNIPKDSYLLTRFALQQPGNEKQEFENCFDYSRNCFCFRRALTLAQVRRDDGNVGYIYSHYRFLRSRDDDEPAHVTHRSQEWQPKLPLIWDTRADVFTPIDMTGRFVEYVSQVEKSMRTFIYYLFIDYQRILTERPIIDAVIWPKPTRTAVYLNGKTFSVDESMFISEWPSFRKFMSNFDKLSPSNAAEMIDLMGIYYHIWPFTSQRVSHLVQTAEKCGFYDFAHIPLSTGNNDVYAASIRSVAIVGTDHPLHKFDSKQWKTSSTESLQINLQMVYNELETGADPTRTVFKSQNEKVWGLSMSRQRYVGVEYLSVSCLVNGDYAPGEQTCWKVELKPDVKNPKILKRVSHIRVLNTVQRSICFPTCYLWSDVEKEMGANGPFKFQLLLSQVTSTGWNLNEVAGGKAASGVVNGDITCSDGKKIPINRDFLRSTCGYYYTYCYSNDEARESSHDMTHFLDHLYHGSKLYTDLSWKGALASAWESSCPRILDALERAAIRSGKPVNYYPEEFEELATLNLEFYHKHRKTFGIVSVDEFLENQKQAPFGRDLKPATKIVK